MKESAEKITNVNMDNVAWVQCTLPIKNGGLGLTLAADIATSAFISSMLATENLRSQMIQVKHDEILTKAINVWKLESSTEMQKSWVNLIMESKFENLLVSSKNDAGLKARLQAASQEESGARLNALPSSSLRLCLDNDTFEFL